MRNGSISLKPKNKNFSKRINFNLEIINYDIFIKKFFPKFKMDLTQTLNIALSEFMNNELKKNNILDIETERNLSFIKKEYTRKLYSFNKKILIRKAYFYQNFLKLIKKMYNDNCEKQDILNIILEAKKESIGLPYNDKITDRIEKYYNVLKDNNTDWENFFSLLDIEIKKVLRENETRIKKV